MAAMAVSMLSSHVLRAACRRSVQSFQAFPIAAFRHPPLSRMASTLPNLAILRAIAEHDPASPAIVHGDSQQSFSYGSLLQDVVAAKDRIWDNARGTSLEGERIAFLAENSYDYVGMQHVHLTKSF